MRTKGFAAAAVLVLAAAVLLLQILSMPIPASDAEINGIGPKPVNGHVTDLLGNPVEGANVTVVIKSGTTTRATMYYDSTEPDGYYTVTFGPSDWDVGNVIEVTARYTSQTAQNSTSITAEGPQTVDVQYSFAIPEFGSALPIAVTGIVALLIVIRRRRMTGSLAVVGKDAQGTWKVLSTPSANPVPLPQPAAGAGREAFNVPRSGRR